MNKLTYSKKLLVLVLVSIIVFIVLVLTFLIFISSSKSKPSDSNSFTIEPNPGSILPLDTKSVFTLTASKPLTKNDKIDLKEQLVSSESSTKASFSTQIEPGNKTIILTLNSLPVPLSIYTVTVEDTSSNTQLFLASFTTDQPAPTPISSNNPNLAKYLPYETTNYKFSYDQSQNLYIFNFKYDSVSSVPSLDQYNQAKSDALNFIKSKGINPTSVVVDWRHS